MLRRRRESNNADRPRRHRVLAVLPGFAIAAIAGSLTLAGNLPAFGLAVQSDPPAAVASAPAPSLPASPEPTAVAQASAAASAPPSPAPCEPPSTIAPAKVLSHGSDDEKVVALTFDDGLNGANTRQILGILEREKVNATFFPTGVALSRLPDVWQAVARAGFPIANHTYSHAELKGMCFEAQREELARASALLLELGIPEFPVMRPPFELMDKTTAVAAAAQGFQAVVLWNVDTRDWQGISARSIRRRALAGGRGDIILMHTFPEATASALPKIIEGYRERGYTFATIGQLLDIDGPVPYPEPAN